MQSLGCVISNLCYTIPSDYKVLKSIKISAKYLNGRRFDSKLPLLIFVDILCCPCIQKSLLSFLIVGIRACYTFVLMYYVLCVYAKILENHFCKLKVIFTCYGDNKCQKSLGNEFIIVLWFEKLNLALGNHKYSWVY